MRLRLLFKYSSTFLPATADTEYPQRQLGDAFRFSLPPVAHAYVEYPQRELGDRFRSSLGAQRTTANLNSRRGLNLKAGLGAFTDSRRWYPHWFPFSVGRSDLNHPPTAVGGIQRTDRKLKRVAYKLSVLLSLLLLLLAVAAQAQTSSFTYQGRLTDGGTAANGNYDLQFAIFDSLSGGAQVGSTQTINTVPVSNGVFTVSLDFGANSFPGANRFLEISARPTGGSFTLLSPRQQITSTPYAVRSLNASSADSVPASGVPAGSGNYIQNSASPQSASNFNISGNGTVGGTLSGNVVNATTQYNLNGSRILSSP